MRRGLLSFLCLAFLLFAYTPVSATLITGFDNTLTSAYWYGTLDNPVEFVKEKGVPISGLVNSNPETEEAWLEALLGLTYDDGSVELYSKIEYPADPEVLLHSNYNPGFNFEYAVVKYGNFWAAYESDPGAGGLDVLNVGPLENAISHVTYFNGTPIPEPSTMLLLGFGLIGLAAFGRKRFF
jgi:hypothetical protein